MDKNNVRSVIWKKVSDTEFLAIKDNQEVGTILKIKARFWVFHDSLVEAVPFVKLIQSVRFLKSIAIAS